MCLGSHAHQTGCFVLNQKDLNSEAQEKYDTLVSGTKVAWELLDDNNGHSSVLRGILLGKKSATVEELMQQKLYMDLYDKKNPDKMPDFAKEYVKDIDVVDCLRKSTEELLEAFPKQVRGAFYYQRNQEELHVGTVKNMFGLSDQWRGKIKSVHGIGDNHSLHFRKRVIRYCFDIAFENRGNYNDYPRVNPCFAKQAYKKAMACEQRDLHALTDTEKCPEFHEKFDAAITRKYLDKLGDEDGSEDSDRDSSKQRPKKKAKKGNHQDRFDNFEFKMSDEDPGHPTVHTTVVRDKYDPSSEPSWYKRIDRPISIDSAREVLRCGDRNTSLYGLGGKDGAFVRVCSTRISGGAEFVVAKQHMYPSAPTVDKQETELMVCANKVLRTLFDTLQEINPHMEITDTLLADTSQGLVASIAKAGYSAHNDFTEMICLNVNEKKLEVSPNVFLPTQDNLIILTLVMSNDNEADTCYLEITNKDGKKIGEIPLSNFCFHIQGPKANRQGWKHGVKFRNLKRQGLGGVWRYSITFRLSMDPNLNADVYMQKLSAALNGRPIQSIERPPNSLYSNPRYAVTGAFESISSPEATGRGCYNVGKLSEGRNRFQPKL